MMIDIPGVLTPEQVQHCRQVLESAEWSDGKLTAGHSALAAKQNLQLPVDSQPAVELGNLILDAIGHNPQFVAATLPLKVLPPMFNCYRGGGTYGNHVDNAIRQLPGSPHRVRTDVSCTLFSATRTNTTAVSWWSRTPTARAGSNCPPGIWWFTPAPVCTGSHQ